MNHDHKQKYNVNNDDGPLIHVFYNAKLFFGGLDEWGSGCDGSGSECRGVMGLGVCVGELNYFYMGRKRVLQPRMFELTYYDDFPSLEGDVPSADVDYHLKW